MEKKPITPEGQTKLRSELDHLKNIKRQEIIDAISEARAHGDLKENAEYHAAREEQGLNEARIRELEEVLSVSQVVEYKTMGVEDRVIFGSTVTVKDLENQNKRSFKIVGKDEADISKGLIYFKSPMGKSIIGKTVKELVIVNTPSGEKNFEILEVKYI